MLFKHAYIRVSSRLSQSVDARNQHVMWPCLWWAGAKLLFTTSLPITRLRHITINMLKPCLKGGQNRNLLVEAPDDAFEGVEVGPVGRVLGPAAPHHLQHLLVRHVVIQRRAERRLLAVPHVLHYLCNVKISTGSEQIQIFINTFGSGITVGGSRIKKQGWI